MSSPELSHEFDLRQMTCWEFKRKVQQAMRSSMRYPLTGTVHVDEFLIGEYEEGQTRRQLRQQKKVSCCRIGSTGKRRCRQGLCQGGGTRFR